MIDLKTLYELGIPRLPELTGPAMKAANKAVSNGAKPAAVKALVSTLAHSASPTEEPMGELKQLFMPLAKLLAKARAEHTFYTEREILGEGRRGGCGVPADGKRVPPPHRGRGRSDA